MLNFRIRTMLGPLVLAAASVLPANAQAPARERIDFTISTPFKLRKSDVVLPAGKYLLEQEGIGEGNAFALYSDPMKKPLAVLETVSFDDGFLTPTPENTEIMLDRTTLPEGEVPMLEGWRLPGGEEWQVIAVVPNKKEIERREQQQLGSPAQPEQ